MDKRDFLAAGLLTPFVPLAHAADKAPRASRGPGLLTVAGAIGRANRGALDPALDQMLHKHGIRFERAWVFDAAALAALPAVTIRPTLEYDGKPHTLSGPTLASVLAAAGADRARPATLGLRAVDGYLVSVPLADALAWRMIIATHVDGAPMALGGLGPQWAVYDADTLPAFRDKALPERFVHCPWGLYFIEIG